MECFFNQVEKNLSTKVKNGILIADMAHEIRAKREKRNPWEFLDESKLKGSKGGSRIENVLRKIFFDTQSWKEIFVAISSKPVFKRRYMFEKRSHYLLDNIHYVDSRTSILIQLADILLFILNRIFSYTSLNYYEGSNRNESYSDYKYGLDESSINTLLLASDLYVSNMFKCPNNTFDIQYKEAKFFYPTGRFFDPAEFERRFVKGEA